MLYTVIAPQNIWENVGMSQTGQLQRIQWGNTQIFVDGAGVVNTVLSSDPAVFLRLNAQYPCGRLR